jgi:hypothetical protein
VFREKHASQADVPLSLERVLELRAAGATLLFGRRNEMQKRLVTQVLSGAWGCSADRAGRGEPCFCLSRTRRTHSQEQTRSTFVVTRGTPLFRSTFAGCGNADGDSRFAGFRFLVIPGHGYGARRDFQNQRGFGHAPGVRSGRHHGGHRGAKTDPKGERRVRMCGWRRFENSQLRNTRIRKRCSSARLQQKQNSPKSKPRLFRREVSSLPSTTHVAACGAKKVFIVREPWFKNDATTGRRNTSARCAAPAPTAR